VEAGFRGATIVSTLAGVALYASFGYAENGRFEAALAGGLTLPVVRMGKALSGAGQAPREPEAHG
jgi:hypothetical protein